MKTSTSALPTDTHALQQMVLQMQAELSDNHKKLSAQDSVIDNLRHQLAVLKRARFGRSSEQFEHNIHQLELQLEELEIAQAQTAPSSSAANSAKKTPRRRIT